MMNNPKETNYLSIETIQKLDEFQTKGNVTEAQIQNMKRAINASPRLAENINTAIGRGEIIGFELLPPNKVMNNTQGDYDATTKILRISPDLLDLKDKQLGDLIFVLGHETQHSLDELADLTKEMHDKLKSQVQAKDGIRDYTDEVQWYVETLRKKEARAEIEGFNSLVDSLKKHNNNVTLKNILSSRDYMSYIEAIPHSVETGNFLVKGYKLASNLELDKDMFLDINNEKNIQSMEELFFHKTSYYPNLYASYCIQDAIESEQVRHGKNSKINLNMTELGKLGITKEELEKNGIDFQHINIIGGKEQTKTSSIENSTPSIYAENRIQTIKEISENTVLSARTQKLIQQCDEQFTALCERRGITADHPQEMENVKMAIVFAALSKDMTKIDKMDFGENRTLHLLSYEPHGILASVSTDEAVNIHVSESLGKVQHLEQHMAQQAQERQIAQSQQQSKGLYIG